MQNYLFSSLITSTGLKSSFNSMGVLIWLLINKQNREVKRNPFFSSWRYISHSFEWKVALSST